MDPILARFLRANYQQHPAAVTPVAEIVAGFRDSLAADDLPHWTRGRIIGELAAAGYEIGVREKVAHVGGLLPRHVAYRSVAGRLEATYAR